MLEAPRLVAGFHDLAMVGETVEECGCHLRIAKHRRPFTESKVCRDDDRGALVEPADQVEQELTSGLGQRQIDEFIEDDEVEARKVIGHPTLLAVACLYFQPVNQVNDIVEASTCAVTDERTRNCNGEMALACSCAADKDDIALVGDKGAGGQLAHQGFIDGRICKIKVIDVFRQRQLGDSELVTNGACLLLSDFRLQEVTDKRGGSYCRLIPLPMTSS